METPLTSLITRGAEVSGIADRLPACLLGHRVSLRPYKVTDTLAVWEAIEETRSSLSRWIPDIGSRGSLAAVRDGLSDVTLASTAGRSRVFGVWDREGNRFLGEAGLYSVDWTHARGEVGYWLRNSAQGRGLATEAMRLLLAHLVGQCGLQRVEAHVAVDNTASQRLAERLGFGLVDRRPPVARWDGDVAQVLIYVLTAKRSGSQPSTEAA